MHPTPIFTNHDKGQALNFAADYPFATLAVNGEEGPVTALVPLTLNKAGDGFLGHVAKANPFWEAAQAAGKGVAVFRGPDAYVSPSSYPSKAEHHKAVPTWNYMAVEIRGQITVQTQADKMGDYLEPLTEKMESHRELPWKISDAPEDYIAKLSSAIIGFSLRVDELNFVEKLSQNKSEPDREGVINSLDTSELANENAVADIMKTSIKNIEVGYRNKRPQALLPRETKVGGKD